MKVSRSQDVAVRGLRYHVRSWGDPASPMLFLLHGWMDVSASFQFLVDALRDDWHVLAPDWRGFGLSETPQDGYWFADYVADLDALLQAYSPDAPARIAGHSLGANVALLYAGSRPQRVARVVAIDGFGIPADSADRAPEKMARWLDAVAAPPGFSEYPDMAAVADRLQKNNGRLPRWKAEFLAEHWAQREPGGKVRLRADPKHKLPFPTATRIEDMYEIWRRICAPVLFIAGSDSEIPRWLAAGGDQDAEIARRLAHVRDHRLVSVPESGHMVHHDQPETVARLLEPFMRG